MFKITTCVQLLSHEIQLETLSFGKLYRPRLHFSLFVGQLLAHCLHKLLELHCVSEAVSYPQLIQSAQSIHAASPCPHLCDGAAPSTPGCLGCPFTLKRRREQPQGSSFRSWTGCWEEGSSAQQGCISQVNPRAGYCTATSVEDCAQDGAWQLDCMQAVGMTTTSYFHPFCDQN